MPTYEYVCQKCGHEFEKFQSIADKPLTTCPADLCAEAKWGKGKVKKLISAGGGLLFKGSGFYTTDYRSDKYKEAAKKDAAPAAATTGDGKSGVASGDDGKPGSGDTRQTKPSPAKVETKPAKGDKAGS